GAGPRSAADAARPRRRGDRIMATPVVPNQFAVGKNRIIHKPTTATFSFETGHTTFKSINWGRADEQLSWPKLPQRRHHTDCAAVAEQATKIKERHEAARVHIAARRRGGVPAHEASCPPWEMEKCLKQIVCSFFA